MQKVIVPAAYGYITANDRLFSDFTKPATTIIFVCETAEEFRKVWTKVKYNGYLYRQHRTQKSPQINIDQTYAVYTKDIAPMYWKD